jgi:hypothetical protein
MAIDESRVRLALDPLVQALEADGYSLDVAGAGEELELSVVAGPAACAECLVPKPLMQQLMAQALADAGVEVAAERLRLEYPPEHHTA